MKKITLATLALFSLLTLPMSCLAVGSGYPLAPFTATDMSGTAVDMNKIIGKKPVLMIFWASWCPNCKTEVPKVNALYEKYQQQGMVFLGINVGFNDSLERARSFMSKTAMQYPNIFDKDNTITKTYQVQGVPTVILADKKGTIVFRNFGTPEITDEVFAKLMQE